MIELGHKEIFLGEKTPDGFTHNWTLFVCGARKNDISHFVDKVVFHLHDSFKSPKRGYILIALLLLLSAVKQFVVSFPSMHIVIYLKISGVFAI